MLSIVQQIEIEQTRIKLIQLQRARHKKEFQVLRDTTYGFRNEELAQIIQDNWETDEELMKI